MENESKAVVEDFLLAVQQGNNERLGQLLDANVTWKQPGENSISGMKNSGTEVFQMVGKMFEISGNTLKLNDIKSISVNGNEVACVLTWTAAKANGETLEVDNIDVYTVTGGKITNACIFSTDLEKENKFWD